MNPVVRLIVVAVVSFALFHFVYWISLALIPFERYDLAAPFVALLLAGIAAWYLWTSLAGGGAAGILPKVVLWAVVVGAIGFSVGFFGPMVLAPDANQGPLLGIFITGPLGVLLGGAAGFIHAVMSRRNNGSSA